MTENEVVSVLYINSGIRLTVIPGARRRKIVTIKLIAPAVVDEFPVLLAKPAAAAIFRGDDGVALREEFAQWVEEAQDQSKHEALENVLAHIEALESEYRIREEKLKQAPGAT